jgi:hypothetical protein
MATWHSLASARQYWSGAPADDIVLASYLEAARTAVLAYAPALSPFDAAGDPTFVPPEPLTIPVAAGDVSGATAAPDVTGELRFSYAAGIVQLIVSLAHPTGTTAADLVGLSLYAYAPGFEISESLIERGYLGAEGEGYEAVGMWDVDGTFTLLDANLSPEMLPPSADALAIVFYAPSAFYLPVPAHYRLAQIMHARNMWNAGKASTSGSFDGSEYGLSTFPLDWAVKQLLRPQRGMGAIA